MFAIPSPDVLMNLFASAAQVLGLLALCVGGGWFSRRNHRPAGLAAPASRWPFAVVCVLLVGVSVAFLLYHLAAVDSENRRLRANLVRSSTEAGKQVGDVSLKTLSYSGQLQHPRGLSTEDLVRGLAESRPLNLIDVREPEEVEVGRIAGTWARRYPDLQADRSGLIVPGKETVLLCESGNRSSELSDFFAEQGIATKFLIGGYEKWVAEERPIDGLSAAERSDLRAIPDFANKETLLSTAQIEAMYRADDVLFVDVRYPGDFEQGHLPGAVNVPVRKLRSAELAEALAALPKRPIVVPCYDKRSSFYALILGLRTSRLGYTFRGRYTLPHEFALPAQEKAWVARWNAELNERTLFGSARKLARTGVERLATWTGSLPLAIVIAALLLRLLLLPLASKAERDGIVQRNLQPQLAAVRQRSGGDRVRQQRVTLALLRQHAITPFRNLVGTLVILIAFTLLFAAIDRASSTSTATVLWAPIEAPDPSYVLPAIATALLAAIVAMQVAGRPVGRWVGFLFVAGIAWLMATCRAGVQLYLIVSFGALVVQNLWVRMRLRERGPAALPSGLVPLALAAGHARLGGKARRLGELIRDGHDVPDGFVVPHGHEPTAAELDRAFTRLRCTHVAVRSSAIGEDGEHQSFAGEFRTLLEVDRAGLAAAIAAVRTSYAGRPGGVVVQAMVPAEYAGVMFTEDPAHAGRVLIEAVAGLGEGLVSGTATPTEHRVGRVTGAVAAGEPAPIDVRPLVELGRALERRFGAPQDVEWAAVGGRVLLLQSRHVTRRAGDGSDPVAVRERERARLLALVGDRPADEPAFVAGDYAALLPEPTPYSMALMQEIWAPGGSVDLACRRLGVQFAATDDDPPYLQFVFGRCQVDTRVAATRVRSTAAGGFRLGLQSQRLEEALVRDFLPTHQRAARLRDAIDLARLSTADLHDLCTRTRQDFVHGSYVESEVINLAAEAYFAAARRRLERAGRDPSAMLGRGVRTVVQDAFARLAGDGTVTERTAGFVAAFGHRAPHDFELAEPRFAEAPQTVAAMAGAERPARAGDGGPSRTGDGAGQTPDGADDLRLQGRLLRVEVRRARRFQELKEEAKHAATRDLAFLRRVLLALGERHALGDLVFHLTPAEVDRLPDETFAATAADLARERRQHLAWLREVPVPDSVTPAMLETLGEQQPLPALAPDGLRGIRVAGDRDVVGTVRVLHSPTDLGALGDGEILVVRHTDPCWLPAFRIAGGLVSEVGGWLSHAAIQAREHNLPAIVGLTGATLRLRDGQRVRLHRDGCVECLGDTA